MRSKTPITDAFDAMRAEIARLAAELAAARAVPADVEAAILGIFDGDGESLDRARATIARAIAEARQPATVGGLLPTGLHPDGCHTVDVMATRDCTSDGHHECASCTRFDAAGRAAMGDDPIGGSRGPRPKGG